MMIKRFLAVTTAAVATILSTAAPGLTTGSFGEHKRLYDTIRSYGVTVHINNPKYCDGRIDGSYHSFQRVLSVCQDNQSYMNNEVDWTANDLDTLRHEAHHMIQDCALNGIGDGNLSLLFGDIDQSKEFVASVLPESQQRELMSFDSYSGHNAYRQMIELEEFATAAAISPSDIADKMNEMCGPRR